MHDQLTLFTEFGIVTRLIGFNHIGTIQNVWKSLLLVLLSTIVRLLSTTKQQCQTGERKKTFTHKRGPWFMFAKSMTKSVKLCNWRLINSDYFLLFLTIDKPADS
ncbi:Uncharacterised protein [Vibrio cholerae]|uniref:Uncharacterized protein n=1 Tax=Vibrio cholerae TaxID=666 RepID=A0A655XUK1_VIBCL|nr:Uncharacterised protein [Vibrio cholerae]CSB62315.1 Uncharacterised protein [Vibrio cholerae]CSC03012.1 Uncharacterised protein [Vibrio cholerae]CSC22783.1 Uncharacterised protein [Vibrio cholerae]CSC68411.1 Uncharacterised protein [Vibrio cholerae]